MIPFLFSINQKVKTCTQVGRKIALGRRISKTPASQKPSLVQGLTSTVLRCLGVLDTDPWSANPRPGEVLPGTHAS